MPRLFHLGTASPHAIRLHAATTTFTALAEAPAPLQPFSLTSLLPHPELACLYSGWSQTWWQRQGIGPGSVARW